mmetsp:Transcript_19766/g.52870  ORF Transcript_19766/g.52870 Transcript_19766/m.52870 type:complete len:244 (+) Transcript_19766:334-1065(+)
MTGPHTMERASDRIRTGRCILGSGKMAFQTVMASGRRLLPQKRATLAIGNEGRSTALASCASRMVTFTRETGPMDSFKIEASTRTAVVMSSLACGRTVSSRAVPSILPTVASAVECGRGGCWCPVKSLTPGSGHIIQHTRLTGCTIPLLRRTGPRTPLLILWGPRSLCRCLASCPASCPQSRSLGGLNTPNGVSSPALHSRTLAGTRATGITNITAGTELSMVAIAVSATPGACKVRRPWHRR